MHCTTGNNRTGVFIALLLLLLNVPPQYVVRDYTMSEIGLAPTRHINVERLLKKGAFSEFGEVEARRECERMVGARPESMEALLEEIERRWGGAEGYFLDAVGLSQEEVNELKRILTVEEEQGWRD
jgi:protein tyrosine/serine phosphatase